VRLSPPLAEPPGIAAAVLWLPPGRSTAADAVAAGRIDEPTRDRLGYTALAESTEHAAPQMAVLAGRKALAEAGWSGAEVGMVAHAWIHHQGHDFWSPPHFVADGIGADKATPVGLQQTSNGGVAALEACVARMALDPTLERAAVTTADRFAEPGFDRWFGDIDVAYGDCGTALLLDRSGGPYRVLSIASESASEYEILYRGEDAWTPAPRMLNPTISARRTKMFFRESGGWPRFVGVLRRCVQRAVLGAIDDAGLAPDDPCLRQLVMPRLSAGALNQFYIPVVTELALPHTEIVDLGRDTGHLGAGDLTANLADLHGQGGPTPGSVTLFLSAGNGYTWSCVAIRRE
jgi:3-oxoacyl-[acyl-carrier-protein] synthase III